MCRDNSKKLIITNNPMVFEYNRTCPIIYDAGLSFCDVLTKVRDNIHEGRRLLTHPLSGSIKPHETPYKTVLLTVEKGPLDTGGLEIMEKSIETSDKFLAIYKNKKKMLTERVLQDFQLIDFDLIKEFI